MLEDVKDPTDILPGQVYGFPFKDNSMTAGIKGAADCITR